MPSAACPSPVPRAMRPPRSWSSRRMRPASERKLSAVRFRTTRDRAARLASRHERRRRPGPDRRRQPRGADDGDAPRPPRGALARGRAPRRHRDPPARGPLPARGPWRSCARSGSRSACATTSLRTYSPTGGIVAVESLAGRELATYVKELNEGVEGFSPTVRVFINQDALEPLLRERAVELGATVVNRTEAVAVAQDDDGATVTLRDLDSGEERAVRARYVVAADGNRSPMRARLGIGMRGYGELSRSITIYFRADCSELLRDRNQGVIYVHNPELRGFFRLDRTGGTGFLVINSVGADVTQDAAINVSDGLTEERALGVPAHGDRHADLPMEILHVAHWRAEANWRDPHAGRPRVPRRRRRPRRPAERRLRRQHRRPGRAQPRLEARRGRQGRGRRRRCSTPTRRSGSRSPS